MPLLGTFDVLSFADVMSMLGQRRATGRLDVRTGKASAHFYLADGTVVDCDAPRWRTVEPHDARRRLETVCARLLPAERGTFQFQPGPNPRSASLHLEVRALLKGARRQLEDLRQLADVIPSLEARPVLTTQLAGGVVSVTSDQWRVLRMIDGRRNIRGLARTLDTGEIDVCRALKELLDTGLVTLEEADTPKPSIHPQRPPASGRDANPTVYELPAGDMVVSAAAKPLTAKDNGWGPPIGRSDGPGDDKREPVPKRGGWLSRKARVPAANATTAAVADPLLPDTG